MLRELSATGVRRRDHGKINGIKDPEVVIEVSQGVRLRVLRSAVTSKFTPGDAAKADAKAS